MRQVGYDVLLEVDILVVQNYEASFVLVDLVGIFILLGYGWNCY